jgi:CDP-diacylglycerol--glycerol-3-phosphate 3-phosphatidyltransferase
MAFIEQKARDLSRPPLEAIARVLHKLNVSPDWISNLGLLLTIGVGVLAGLGYLTWAGVAYLACSIFDALDGSLARVSGKGSRFGAFLDSTLDRLEEAIVLVGLAVYYALRGPVWVPPLILLAAVASLMVSYTRARAEGVGVACREGIFSRPLRVLVMAAGLIFHQVVIALVIVAAGGLFTTCQRIYHVWRSTGGEAGGWAAPRDPFATPGMPPARAALEPEEPTASAAGDSSLRSQ